MIREWALDPAGHLVVLFRDGRIFREMPTGDHGGPATVWEEIPGPDGETVTHIAVDPRAGHQIVIGCLSGKIYRRKAENIYQPKVMSWVAVELPP